MKNEKFYGLYDLQLKGFKAGIASTDREQIIREGADRAYHLSQGDIEPIPDTWTDREILNMYDYEVREIDKQEYISILESDDVGLLTKVNLMEGN